MAGSAIAVRLDEALNVHCDFAAEFALHGVVAFDLVTELAISSSFRSFARVSGLIPVFARISWTLGRFRRYTVSAISTRWNSEYDTDIQP